MDTQTQLDRIERKLDTVLQKVAHLDGRTAAIGIVTGALASAVLAIALLAGACSIPAPVLPTESLSDYVVALVNDEGGVYCTGFVTDLGVVTAGHCVSSSIVLLGLRPDLDRTDDTWSRLYRARVLFTDDSIDLALLESMPSWHPRARFRGPPPVVGEEVTVVGHPHGITYITHRGHVTSGIRTAPGAAVDAWFTIDAGLIAGMSGGPIFDAQGLVLGMATGAWEPHLGAGVPSSVIAASIQEHLQ